MTTITAEAPRSGVNLYGLVPLSKVRRPECPAGYSTLVANLDQVRASSDATKALLGERAAADLREKIAKSAHDQIGRMVADQFQAQGRLCPELEDVVNVEVATLELVSSRERVGGDFVRMSKAPRADLSKLRQLADDLGFGIIPFAYLSGQAGHMHDRAILGRVDRFNQTAQRLGFRTYVLTPPMYYGVLEHSRAQDPNIACYDGRHGTLMAVTRQNVLALRTINSMLSGLQDQVKDVRSRLNEAEKNIGTMQRQMIGMSRDIERIQMDTINLRGTMSRELSQLRSEAQAARAQADKAIEMILCMMDPMLLAVPEKTDIVDGECKAYIGPCWGPDIPTIMAQAFVSGSFDSAAQAKLLIGKMNTLWA